MSRPVVIFITASSSEEAAKIGRALVEERLAACANLFPSIRSIYRWEGKVHDEPEVFLMAKTVPEHLEALIARVKALHSYQVPAIIALPILDGSESYLRWVAEETKR